MDKEGVVWVKLKMNSPSANSGCHNPSKIEALEEDLNNSLF
jgi:hypothetical protein